MSTAISARVCGALGCSRSVDVSPSGIRFARCRDHERQALSNALGAQRSAERVSPRLVPPSADRHAAGAVGEMDAA
jgi:hypothetical protein